MESTEESETREAFVIRAHRFNVITFQWNEKTCEIASKLRSQHNKRFVKSHDLLLLSILQSEAERSGESSRDIDTWLFDFAKKVLASIMR